MEKPIMNENVIKNKIFEVLNEELSKVKRDDFTRVQFKIEELQNSLNETIKEFRKLDDCIPNGLKTISKGRIAGISSSLSTAQTLLIQLKEKIRQHKRALYAQNIEEKKK